MRLALPAVFRELGTPLDTQELPVTTPPLVPKTPPRMFAGEEPPPEAPVTEPSAPKKRRWGRRLLAVLLVAVAAFLAWLAASVFLLSTNIERIPQSELPSLNAVGSGPVNYLLVGSDSRADLPSELGGFFGDFGGERADVIMVAHVAGGRLQLLSLPRDLKVQVPGRGTNKINAAYAFGGPDLLVQTVKGYLGMPIHHYVEVGFAEFAAVVDQLGGVAVDFPYAARDDKSGLSVEAGTTELDGPAAVAFVRSRSYMELQGGSWVGVDQSDIGRMGRQQLVVARLIDKARSPGNLFEGPWLAAAIGNSLTADEGLSVWDLTKLGWAVARSGSIDAATLPVVITTEGGVSYVVAVDSEAEPLLDRFAQGEPLTN